MHLGKAVKEIRIQKGLTQTALSELCGLSQTSLSHIEKGTKNPSAKSIKHIAKALEIPEQLLYLYAMEESDVAKEKLFMYQKLFPTIKSLIMDLIGN